MAIERWILEYRKLVKPSDPNKSGGFDGDFTINNGHVALRTKDGIKRNVENLDGTLLLI